MKSHDLRHLLQASSENGELRSNEQLESSLEERIEELRHRLRIEAAVVDGAKNVIRTLQSNKTIDKKALQEVSTRTLFYFPLVVPTTLH